MAKILVTGGSGYIGSHCVVELLQQHYRLVVIDNLVNSVCNEGQTLPESLQRVEKITGKKIEQFYAGSSGDENLTRRIFEEHKDIEVVIHLAALKAVGQSVEKPLYYYRNNVAGTMNLLKVMEDFNVKKLIFSSSATVYGDPIYLPLDEKHPTGQTCSNPYGRGKYMVERILQDMCAADRGWSVACLRYFNPIGSHPSGLIGEDPHDIPNNLMPYLTQVAAGVRPVLNIFGKDYDTVDGTGVRDYLHIDDLSTGHIATLRVMLSHPIDWIGFHPINLGTGKGYSVLQVCVHFFLFQIACSNQFYKSRWLKPLKKPRVLR